MASAIVFGACGIAGAEVTVAPVSDSVYTFDSQEKFQLFFPPNGVAHAGGVMHWRYQDTSRPAGISMATVLSQIQASMAKWTAVCKISFVYDGTTTAGFSSWDGINVIGWDPTGIAAPTTGITTVAAGGTTLTDADIRLNAAYSVTYSWGLDSTLTHEVGHAIGLQHSDVEGQVMSGPPLTSYTGASALRSDDIAGCVHQYGAPSAPVADSQAPSVPASLVATASSTSTSIINLAWLPSTDNVGVANYKIFQNGTQVGTVTSVGGSVSGLAAGTTYSLTVAACDAAGNCSAQSSPASATTLAASTPSGGAVQNYQDLWWSPGENGWGVTITQHRDVLFIAWYVYDAAGKPVWVVMSSGQWDATHTIYTGNVYTPTGSWFENYDGTRFAVGAPAGTASFTFTSTTAATLSYNVNGLTGTKAITRLLFGPVDSTPIGSYADTWWAGTQENGWGLVLNQQYHSIFAAWFTYDTTGQTTWFVMSGGSWTSANTYSGEIYRTQGAQVLGATYNQAAFNTTPVGTLTLTFTDADHATMTYTVDGAMQTKSITRLGF